MGSMLSNFTVPVMSRPRFENALTKIVFLRCIKRTLILSLVTLLLFASALAEAALAQNGGSHTLYGDLKVDETQTSGLKPIAFDVVLYFESGTIVSRQTVSNNGRFRFMNLSNGNYDLVVEVENKEVARLRVFVSSPFKNDFRQDVVMAWHADHVDEDRGKKGTVSVADIYKRAPANQTLFNRADEAIRKKNYDQAIVLLHQIVGRDPKDYQAWTELGTMHLIKADAAEAEKAYLRALKERSSFITALINLGRLRIARKDYEGAIETLSRAVEKHPQSPDANHLLGEAYLQIKKGSKAVGYLNEAIRLDPIGKANAHLRLATLYNGAGMKDKAALEYEQFLKKKPDHADKKKLQQYITENKKP